jgi:hypothetical protein
LPSPTVEPDPDNAGGGKIQPSRRPSSGGFFSDPQPFLFDKPAKISISRALPAIADFYPQPALLQ